MSLQPWTFGLFSTENRYHFYYNFTNFTDLNEYATFYDYYFGFDTADEIAVGYRFLLKYFRTFWPIFFLLLHRHVNNLLTNDFLVLF